MQIKKHNLFETPLYHLKEPKFLNLNKVCNKYIKEGKEYSKPIIKKREKLYKKKIGDFGISHASTTLLEEPKIKKFGEFVGQITVNILESQGYNLSKHRVDFSELWVQEFGKNGGGHQRVHTHYSHISGFYFLKCSEKTSYPIFHDPRPGAMMIKLPFKEPVQSCTITQADLRPEPGDFIFFNSYLPHEFVVDPGVEPFRFIHFNLVCLPEKYFQHEFSKK
jgi:uncharacterized protein (TIGR02466 family)